MNRKIVWAFLFASLFCVSLLTSIHVVKADSNDYIHFSSGVTLLSPVNRTYNSRFLTLNFTFACGWGIKYSLNYTIDGKYGGPMPYTIKNPTELHVVYSATGSVKLPELSEGSHSLTISLEAEVTGPDNPWSYADTIYFNIDTTAPNFTDTTPPNITIQLPENTTYTTTSIPLNFTLNEQTTNITYCLDGNKITMAAENTTLTGLSIGQHNLTISAQDAAGNIGTSQTANFSITNPTPTPTPLESSEPSPTIPIAAAATVLAAGSSLGVLAYLKKHKH